MQGVREETELLTLGMVLKFSPQIPIAVVDAPLIEWETTSNSVVVHVRQKPIAGSEHKQSSERSERPGQCASMIEKTFL